MKRLMGVLCVAVVLHLPALAQAGVLLPPPNITIDVYPSLAPNRWGSPSWPGYVGNALAGMEAGQPTYGSSSSPSYYSQIANGAWLPTRTNIVTGGFSAWDGVANPGGAFTNELGNRLEFGVVIKGNGTKISLSQLSFALTSTDPAFSYSKPANGAQFQYHEGNNSGTFTPVYDWVGIVNGQIVTDANTLNTKPVDELIGWGFGNADDVLGDSSTGQSLIDAKSLKNYSLTGTYRYGDVTGSATVNFGVPEPATLVIWSLLGAGSWLGLRVSRRRRSGMGDEMSGPVRQSWSPEARQAIHAIVARGSRQS